MKYRDYMTRAERVGAKESTTSILATAVLFLLSVVAMSAFVVALTA